VAADTAAAGDPRRPRLESLESLEDVLHAAQVEGAASTEEE
jgi:hypothetical protein